MFKQFTLTQLSLIALLTTTGTNLHAMQAQAVLEKIEPEIVEKTKPETKEPRFSKADKTLLAAGIVSGAIIFGPKLYGINKLNILFRSQKATPIVVCSGILGVVAASTTAAVKDFDKTKKLTEQKKSVYASAAIASAATVCASYVASIVIKAAYNAS